MSANARGTSAAAQAAASPASKAQGADLNTRLKQLISKEPVMLFMKGAPGSSLPTLLASVPACACGAGMSALCVGLEDGIAVLSGCCYRAGFRSNRRGGAIRNTLYTHTFAHTPSILRWRTEEADAYGWRHGQGRRSAVSVGPLPRF